MTMTKLRLIIEVIYLVGDWELESFAQLELCWSSFFVLWAWMLKANAPGAWYVYRQFECTAGKNAINGLSGSWHMSLLACYHNLSGISTYEKDWHFALRIEIILRVHILDQASIILYDQHMSSLCHPAQFTDFNEP